MNIDWRMEKVLVFGFIKNKSQSIIFSFLEGASCSDGKSRELGSSSDLSSADGESQLISVSLSLSLMFIYF